MNDVAAAAGVGLKTVSRVVNGESGVSPAMAARVNAAIAELGFRRNDSARLLRTGRTASIALLLEDIADPFSSALTRAVEDVAAAEGCLVFTGSSGEHPLRERELALAFCARRVDGLVVVPMRRRPLLPPPRDRLRHPRGLPRPPRHRDRRRRDPQRQRRMGPARA